jgi:hypothetical protein
MPERQQPEKESSMTDRKLHQQKMAAQLHEWNARVDTLVARARRYAAQGGIALQQQIESLLHKRETVRNKLESLQRSVEAHWDRASRELDDAWSALKAGWETAQTHLKTRERASS